MTVRRSLVWLLSIVLLVPGGIIPRAPGSVQAANATFINAPCPFPVGSGESPGQSVRCGYVLTPENPARRGSKQLRLAVAIFKSQSSHRAPDPVIFLQGGPGGALLSQYGPLITAANSAEFVGDRDLIMFDQRGTGYSRPSLGCPEYAAIVPQALTLRDATAVQLAAFDRCHDRLVRSGIDPNDYSTIADAGDVLAVSRALGYQKVNLYGVSYGTRLALTTIRLYDSAIRSVVLDSVYPPQINNYSSPFSTLVRALNMLFSGCAADAACNASYPHLERTFYDLVTRLNARPITLRLRSPVTHQQESVLLTGDAVVSVLFQGLYQTSLIPSLPAFIASGYAGHYDLLAEAYELFSTLEPQVISYGDYLAVQCGEDAPYVTASQVRSSVENMPAALRSTNVADTLAGLQECTHWRVRPVPLSQKAAVTSAVPTLILSGQYDPITPPANGILTGRTLIHHFFFSFPGVGHGVRFFSGSCPDAIVNSFLAHPLQRPASACIGAMHAPHFIGG